MARTSLEQLKREALAGLDRLDATLANMPPLLSAKPKRWRSDVSDVAACAAVEGRTI
jgi:hypothetical protein